MWSHPVSQVTIPPSYSGSMSIRPAAKLYICRFGYSKSVHCMEMLDRKRQISSMDGWNSPADKRLCTICILQPLTKSSYISLQWSSFCLNWKLHSVADFGLPVRWTTNSARLWRHNPESLLFYHAFYLVDRHTLLHIISQPIFVVMQCGNLINKQP